MSWFDQYTSGGDLSVYYLGLIFGQVNDVLLGEGNDLFGKIFSQFNVIVMALGVIVLVYTTVVSMVNTAQEGEMMGKKWSSAWIPFRSALGIGLLLPLPSGYSLLQSLVMWIVLQGVGAANWLWQGTLTMSAKGVTINQGSSEVPKNAIDAVEAMFKSLLCRHYLNSPQYNANPLGVTYYRELGSNMVKVGVQNGPSWQQDICGSFAPPDDPAGRTLDQGKINEHLSVVITTLDALDVYAEQVVTFSGINMNTDNWGGQGALAIAVRTFYNALPNTLIETFSTDDVLNNAAQDGWLFAGSYYFRLVRPTCEGSPGGVCTPPITFVTPDRPNYQAMSNTDAINPGSNGMNINNRITAMLTTYKNLRGNLPPKPGTNSTMVVSNIGGGAGFSGPVAAIWNQSFGWVFKKAAESFMHHLTRNDPDPLISMSKVGQDMMMIVEISFIAGVLISGIIALISSYGSFSNPMGFAVLAFLSVITPFAMAMMGLLWTAGASLGIYLPMIPFILFTFGGVSWFIAVIESMVAAPIVALGMTAPSGDHLGKAAPAVMLVCNLFLRPSLMVIGFLAGSKLLVIATKMLNYSFSATLSMSVGAIGVFGAVALIVFYSGIAITIVHKSFSLIHFLPDRVLRWIGGQAEQFGQADARDEQSTRQMAETGAKASQSLGQAAMDKVQSSNEKAMEKAKKGMADKLSKGGLDGKDDGGDGSGKKPPGNPLPDGNSVSASAAPPVQNAGATIVATGAGNAGAGSNVIQNLVQAGQGQQGIQGAAGAPAAPAAPIAGPAGAPGNSGNNSGGNNN